jgi:hypothetical protein
MINILRYEELFTALLIATENFNDVSYEFQKGGLKNSDRFLSVIIFKYRRFQPSAILRRTDDYKDVSTAHKREVSNFRVAQWTTEDRNLHKRYCEETKSR